LKPARCAAIIQPSQKRHMAKQSAGILMYRFRVKSLEVFLVHPGGPFWKNKDSGAWSIPKGEFTESEDPLNAARREFEEETGFQVEGWNKSIFLLDTLPRNSYYLSSV